MPNFVYNLIEFDNRTDDFDRICEENTTVYTEGSRAQFNFNKIVPAPKNPPANSWSYAHWGSRGNAYDTCIGDHEITFTTSWEPPTFVARAFAKKHPNMAFTWYWCEEGMDTFAGALTSDGKGTVRLLNVKGNDCWPIYLYLAVSDDDCINDWRLIDGTPTPWYLYENEHYDPTIEDVPETWQDRWDTYPTPKIEDDVFLALAGKFKIFTLDEI